ncbi:hypothetical protein Tco_1019178 [Tanacetum coccineum]|uniref:CCHC-type domain-containing protein n=1 Tax=Tanacetum coccineum TaxID=301880 RepID=A0ABQ5FXP8_9ASTR
MAAGQKKPEAQWTADERKAANLDQRLKSLIMSVLPNDQMNSDFQDSPDNEEDTSSSHEYLNDLEEEYQSRARLAKSKRFFKKDTQRFSSAKATDQTECHKCGKKGKNKGLIAKTYDWDDEEVSSDENEVTKVKALIALTDEERVLVGKESARNGDWTKISMKKHVNTEILKENQNLRLKLKELTSITKTWLNSSNKVNQCINEQIPTQKKKILGINQLTKDTSSFGSKYSIFIKSLADNSYMSITSSNIPKSSKTEDSTLPNQDTDEVPSNESQKNTTNSLVVVSDSSATDYDSTDESSVCSTPLLSLKKLDGVEPCKRTNHRTCDHAEFMSFMNANQHHTSQGESSSRSRPSRPSVSFLSCIHCGYNDHHSNDCLYNPTCEICRSYDHDTHGHNRIISLRSEINPRNPQHVTKNCETCGSNVHTTSDHNEIEWFRKRETIQAKNAESFKASKNDSSNALRSKTLTKRWVSRQN